jgi:hypothetical protein
MIAAITESTINWINSGFEGGPSFVTNFGQFRQEIADNTALDFILGPEGQLSELGFLCSPFSLNIRIALAVNRQPYRDRIRCSLGEVSDNIERFFQGNFSSGGWPAWFRLSLRRDSNPYSAYAGAIAELDARIGRQQLIEDKKLDWGQGFFSKERCVEYAGATSGSTINPDDALVLGGEPLCIRSEIQTPGQVINDNLSRTFNLSANRLAFADELDEIITALFGQLTREVIQGVNGLRGASNRSSSSGVSNQTILERLVAETEANATQTAGEVVDTQISGGIGTEAAYLQSAQVLLAQFDIAEAQLAAAVQCIEVQLALQQVVDGNAQAVIAARTLAETTLANISGRRTFYQAELARSAQAAQALASLEAQAALALSVESLNSVSNRYESILPLVHTAAEVSTAQNEATALTQTITTVQTTVPACATAMTTP